MAFPSSSLALSTCNFLPWTLPKFQFLPSTRSVSCRCKCVLDDFKFVLHDALDFSGIDTSHARAARVGFCSHIKEFSDIERGTSIAINRGVDLARAALQIAAEDDSLISHSSVPLPVDDFIERLDNLSMGYCSQYSSSFRSSPENYFMGYTSIKVFEEQVPDTMLSTVPCISIQS
ncbi:hypothetical protein AAHA92_06690 [Salvia divinorum]|uniref:Uncharacterized protein n=1 Tax=Salvia divinorum TaxID=28513 RepID=A0ABD1I7K4_SALDI